MQSLVNHKYSVSLQSNRLRFEEMCLWAMFPRNEKLDTTYIYLHVLEPAVISVLLSKP